MVCPPPRAASVVRPAAPAPAPGPSGVVRPPPRSRPHSVPEGGGSRTAVPARRALVVRPSAALRGVRTRPSRGEALGDTRWRTHLSPAAAQPLRRGSIPAHRHAALGPAPCVSWRRQLQRQRQRLLRARPNGSRGAAPPPPPPSPRLPPPPTLWPEIPPSPTTNRN